jgi:hypothetical protein
MHDSKKLIGTFPDKAQAISALIWKYKISKEQVYNLQHINQTQVNSYEEPAYDGEFVLEEQKAV